MNRKKRLYVVLDLDVLKVIENINPQLKVVMGNNVGLIK